MNLKCTQISHMNRQVQSPPRQRRGGGESDYRGMTASNAVGDQSFWFSLFKPPGSTPHGLQATGKSLPQGQATRRARRPPRSAGLGLRARAMPGNVAAVPWPAIASNVRVARPAIGVIRPAEGVTEKAGHHHDGPRGGEGDVLGHRTVVSLYRG